MNGLFTLGQSCLDHQSSPRDRLAFESAVFRHTTENTIRLLRQYFPQGQPIDGFTQRQPNAVARELNGRPRQTLNFSTPA